MKNLHQRRFFLDSLKAVATNFEMFYSFADMILEVAILNVRSGMRDAFETAFREASLIISSIPGYLSHELRRCVENSNQ